LRASHPTLVVASRAISTERDTMVTRWSDWLGERMTASRSVRRPLIERQLRLILDLLIALVGPLRREAKPIWGRVTEHYGRLAAARGLAAGEVVEEMQYLRELLIRHLAPAIAALRPRQGMALLLRLNRLVDKGVAMAVVGYTDALVHTMLAPSADTPLSGPPGVDPDQLKHELDAFAEALATITRKVVTSGDGRA
jgi:hypothetical protein